MYKNIFTATSATRAIKINGKLLYEQTREFTRGKLDTVERLVSYKLYIMVYMYYYVYTTLQRSSTGA